MDDGSGRTVSQEISYQTLLRGIGAYLDEEPSCRITLAEVPDGFLVRLQRHLHRLDPVLITFQHESIRAQLMDLMRSRKRTGLRVRHQGIWALFPNGHQDFFRALGYELDQRQASYILVDELEDGILVTFRAPDPERSGGRKKDMFILGLPEIEAILNAAFERRKKSPSDLPPTRLHQHLRPE